jgi:hypothetical protein
MSEEKDTINEDKSAQVNGEKKLTKIKLGDKEINVVNSVTVMEIVVHKLETGQEVQQVIAHEFMMADQKPYMVRLLTEAINTVMRAQKRQNYIELCTSAMFNKLRNNAIAKRFLNSKKRRLN